MYSNVVVIKDELSLSYFQCPHCLHWQTFVKSPLILICGASGSGKSSLLPLLIDKHKEINFFDLDLFWRDSTSHTIEGQKQDVTAALRVAKTLCQSGRASAILTSISPIGLINHAEIKFFQSPVVITLFCQPERQKQRLLSRAYWRRPELEEIQCYQEYNQFLSELSLHNGWLNLNTSENSIEDTLIKISDYLCSVFNVYK